MISNKLEILVSQNLAKLGGGGGGPYWVAWEGVNFNPVLDLKDTAVFIYKVAIQ